jgi:hypothetical protein
MHPTLYYTLNALDMHPTDFYPNFGGTSEVQSVHTVRAHATVRDMIHCRLTIVTVPSDPSEGFSLQKQSGNMFASMHN